MALLVLLDLTSWKKHIVMGGGGGISSSFPLRQGLLQGSCLGPLLFSIYTRKLFDIVQKHLPQVHCYGTTRSFIWHLIQIFLGMLMLLLV